MENKKINILLVSYFFSPDKRVGALRTSYWYKNLPLALNCEVEVLTANKDANGKGVHFIPRTGKFSRFSLIKDEGILWKKNVMEYLNKDKITTPDIVIISGSPFMHFTLAHQFKVKFNCKVILDYRDPFSRNPGFNNSGIKISVKRFFERSFNRHADALVTVNDFCAKLIEGFNKKPHAIIQNGYDDSVQPNLKEIDTENLSFSYAGKFYFDPLPIIESLEKLNLPLIYIGPDEHMLSPGENSRIQSKGFVSYPESVEWIANTAVGIIQTYGEDFQSTTKIFDYVRCNRIILIVSNKYIEQGSIHEELKGYPNVYWAKNKSDSIIRAINKIKSSRYIEPPKDFHSKFSRKAQMMKLIDLIRQLT